MKTQWYLASIVILGIPLMLGSLDAQVGSHLLSSWNQNQNEPQWNVTMAIEQLTKANITLQDSAEKTLLEQILPQDTKGILQIKVALIENDRGAIIAWIETNEVLQYFTILRESLITTFSSEIAELRDEDVQKPLFRTHHVLSFFDPKLGKERFTFLQEENRLYEIHTPVEKESLTSSIVDTLTRIDTGNKLTDNTRVWQQKR